MKTVLLLLLLVLASSASGEIYRWRDGAGVFHYSNSLDDVPLRQRERVKVMNYDPVQKGATASPQVAPSGTQQAVPGISTPGSANDRSAPARDARIRKRSWQGAVRSATETSDTE